jgi:hypothetical protein
MSRAPHRWRDRAGIVAAVGAVATLLALPPPAERAVSPAAGEPRTLAARWPAATLVRLTERLPDGASYDPRLVLDADRSVGLLAGSDGGSAALVLRSAADADHPRILQVLPRTGSAVVDAVARSTDRLYWMLSAPDAQGLAVDVLWVADLAGGPARQVSADVGRVAVRGSQYDLQVLDDRVVWMAATPFSATSQLRWVGLAGGPVQARDLDGIYTLSAWPWLTSDTGRSDPTTALVSAQTGERRTVAAPAATDQIACTPTWCRVTSPGAGHATVALMRPDGTGRQVATTRGEEPATVDVALVDRFEVLVTALPGRMAARESLTLYDLATGRHTMVALVVSRTARDGWLWWATSDGDTTTWQLLDLHQLR